MNKLILSKFISNMGDWAGMIALSVFVYRIKSSLLDVSLLYAAKALGYIFGGNVSKLLLKKKFLRVGTPLCLIDTIRGSLLLLIVIDPGNTFLIIGMYFLVSVLSVSYDSIISTHIRNSFLPEQWASINSSLETGSRLAIILAPMFMGIVIEKFGIKIGITIDAISFMLSALIISKFGHTSKIISSQELGTLHKISIEQYKWLFLAFLSAFASGIINVAEIGYIMDFLKKGPTVLGLAISLSGFGGILGLSVSKRKITTTNVINILTIYSCINTFSILVLNMTRNLPIILLAFVCFGFSNFVLVIGMRVIFSIITSESNCLRVMTLRSQAFHLGILFGGIVSATLSESFGVRATFSFSAIIFFLIGFAAFTEKYFFQDSQKF